MHARHLLLHKKYPLALERRASEIFRFSEGTSSARELSKRPGYVSVSVLRTFGCVGIEFGQLEAKMQFEVIPCSKIM